MWGWLGRLLTQPTEQDDQDHSLEEAQRARADAERKLAETERMEGEVLRLSHWAKRIRSDNHFSARISEAFGRVRD